MDPTSMLNALPGWLSDAVSRTAAGGGLVGGVFARATMRHRDEDVPTVPAVSERPARVAIGPANEVAQAYLWARALEESNPKVAAVSFTVNAPPGGPTDLEVSKGVSIRSTRWQQEFSEFLLAQTHVINESARPMLGRLKNLDAFAELAWLRRHGVATALIFHGSDIRDPDAHLRHEKWSPFAESEVPRRLLRRRTAHVRRGAIESGMPLFVTTPDLLRDLPEATWCPVVIDQDRWYDSAPRSSETPLVVHAPSRAPLKGTALISGQLRDLADQKVIRYREVSGIPADEMSAVYADADIVLDQFRIGAYGAAACEAMASGSVVVGHVTDEVRDFVRTHTGVELPIVQATPDTITTVIRDLVASPQHRLSLANAGRDFVDRVHSGSFSAAVLAPFLRS